MHMTNKIGIDATGQTERDTFLCGRQGIKILTPRILGGKC